MSEDRDRLCCCPTDAPSGPPGGAPAVAVSELPGCEAATEPCCAGQPASPAPKTTPDLKGGGVPCCGPASQPCNGAEAGHEQPGYRICAFVDGWLDRPTGPVPRIKSRLEIQDTLGRWQMRWGIGRFRYRIAPGLYAVGNPGSESSVLVTANYKMTFDALRRELGGLDSWILVLETHGINVWCAAGKGTFGTDEVVRRVEATELARVVNHRKLILPQLGAPGVSAHEVRKRCGFSVVYGPVFARDVQAFLGAGMVATADMRRVTFTAMERLALTPVELAQLWKPTLWVMLTLFLVAGIGPGFFSFGTAWNRGMAALGVWVAAVLAGAVATPVLLPWLPWRSFSAKGALVGGAVALWLAVRNWEALGGLELVSLLLALPVVSSYVAMHFTGATPFTSPSGVEKEMRRAIPVQAAAAFFAAVAWIGSAFAG